MAGANPLGDRVAQAGYRDGGAITGTLSLGRMRGAFGDG